jgi:ketose-bisphosphate aldolase
MFVNSKQVLKKALRGKYAVGQFNISTIQAVNAIFVTAAKLKSPVIIATSEGEAKHFGVENIAAVVKSFGLRVKIPVILHLDHGKDLDLIKRALVTGYTSIHFDGSALALPENIRLTKQMVSLAHRRGASVEGEVGHIESRYYQGDNQNLARKLTNPDDAKEFVAKTGVDSLAIAIGTVHGAYKGKTNLDIGLLKLIAKRVKIPLVLHGASLLAKKDYDIVISAGIAKININTELRLALVDAIKAVFKKNPAEYVPYKVFDPAVMAMEKVVEEKIKIFCSNNKA